MIAVLFGADAGALIVIAALVLFIAGSLWLDRSPWRRHDD